MKAMKLQQCPECRIESEYSVTQAACDYCTPVAVVGVQQLREVQPVQQKPARKRCSHYAQIKEFFAVAREMGMDTSKDAQDRCRGAVGMLLGRRVISRADLSAAEWAFCTNALRMNRLFW